MFDVLIVGAGPVGSLLAGMLATNNVNVGLVDQCRDDSRPRAMTVNARTAQILDVFGLRSRILNQSPIMHANFAGTMASFETVDTPWPGQWPCEQNELTTTLQSWAASEGAHTIWNTRITGICRREEPHVLALTRSPKKNFSARLIIGADGTDSTIRCSLDAPKTETRGHRTFITANIEADRLPKHRFNETDSGIVLSTGEIRHGFHRVMMFLPPHISTANRKQPDIGELWHLATGAPFPGKVVAATTQTDSFSATPMVPTPWSVLLGDAAHGQLPVGGCSLNYGLEDAFALAWRIPELIETGRTNGLRHFARERRNAWHRMQAIIKTEINRRYPSPGSTDHVQESTINVANFLSGTDIDYSSSNTGASRLSTFQTRTPSPTRIAAKNAQRMFHHISVEDTHSNTSGSNSEKTVRTNRSLKNLTHPHKGNAHLIRPDGFIVTNALGQR